MNDQTLGFTSARGGDLDPEIWHFVTAMGPAFASYPTFNNLPLPEMRQACERCART